MSSNHFVDTERMIKQLRGKSKPFEDAFLHTPREASRTVRLVQESVCYRKPRIRLRAAYSLATAAPLISFNTNLARRERRLPKQRGPEPRGSSFGTVLLIAQLQ